MKPRAREIESMELPHEFDSWEKCREYYALEAVFLGQKWERNKTRHNRREYNRAVSCALAANRRCAQPMELDL